ncbi:MAG: DUF4421 domain-containing protein [Chitinophagaceae bacterium]
MKTTGKPTTRSIMRVCPLLLCLLAIIACSHESYGQTDTTTGFNKKYYESYPDRITTRLFLSRKYSSPTIINSVGKDIRYMPNTTLNLGVGATYGWFTLNLAYGFGFLNRDETGKGKTKYLDLQTHIYARKWSIDLLGQFYKGFYLTPKGTATANEDWYTRPDMKVEHMGVAAYRIMNWKKFSYRAALLQNEWQRKSAGSLLLGAEIHYGDIHADSAFVPTSIAANTTLKDIDKIRYATIGPGVGYAYTLVVKEHFYASASVTGTLSVNLTRRFDESSLSKGSVQTGWFYRAGVGYNSSRINVSLLWVNNDFHTTFDGGRYLLRTGNFRFNMAYRITAGPKLLRHIRFLSVK